MQVNILKRKISSKLVKAALAGEEVIIARNGTPVVRLVKAEAPRVHRKPGAWRGLPPPAPDWDDAAANREIADWLVGNDPE